jgi:hypothetical protein
VVSESGFSSLLLNWGLRFLSLNRLAAGSETTSLFFCTPSSGYPLTAPEFILSGQVLPHKNPMTMTGATVYGLICENPRTNFFNADALMICSNS